MKPAFYLCVCSLALTLSGVASADLVINPFPKDAASQAPVSVLSQPKAQITPIFDEKVLFDDVAEYRPAPVQPAPKVVSNGPVGLTGFDIDEYYARFNKSKPVVAAPVRVEQPVSDPHALLGRERYIERLEHETNAQYRVSAPPPPPPVAVVQKDDVNDERISKIEDSLEDISALKARTQNLEAENARLQSQLASLANKPAVVATVSAPPEPITPDVVETIERKKWHVSQGESLREVLSAWSAQEGVEILWISGRDFAVESGMIATTSYEAAVEGLLAQYVDNGPRPVGSLYIDPETGARSLVIQSI